MSEEGLLEEDAIWEYKSIRKPKSKSQNDTEVCTQSWGKTNVGECESKRSRRKKTQITVARNNMDIAKKSTLKQKQHRITGLASEKSINIPTDDHIVSSQNARSPSRQSAKKLSPRIPRPIYEGHCPNCQMPFSVLLVQTPRWHVDECLDAPECAEKECPDGLLCSSTIPSHYRRYTHFQLARSRAGNGAATDGQSSGDTTQTYLLTAAAGSLDSSTTAWAQPSGNTQPPLPAVDTDDISYSPLCSDEETADEVQRLRKRLFYTPPADEDGSETKTGRSGTCMNLIEETSINGYHSTEEAYAPRQSAKQSEGANEGAKTSSFSQTPQSVRTCTPLLLPSPSEGVTIKEEADWTGFSSPVSDEGDWHTQGPVIDSPLSPHLPSCSSFLPPKVEAHEEMPVQTRASSAFREQKNCFSFKKEVCSSSPMGFGGEFAVSQPLALKEELVPLTPSGASPRAFSSPKNNVPSVSVPSVTAIAILSKALKQTDIGVFFGLKPKAKEEKVPERSLSQKAPSSPTAEASNENRRGQRKRKAGGSLGDSDPTLVSPQTPVARAKPPGAGQQGGWPKRFRDSGAVEEKGKKQCPFYKKIPGTGFTVDAFQYGKIEGCTAHFLTHFHSDHYGGLTKKFQFPIYCSKITGNLVRSKLRVEERFINTLPMDTECIVDGIKVVLLEANHCPGAVLLLFCLPNGTAVLHTGDFRADPSMEQYPVLIGCKIHTLYLDTTYCSPEYTFPPQQEAIEFAVATAFEMVTMNPRTLVVCGTYSIGKEKVFLAIADVLGCKVCMSQDKYKTMQCLESKAIASKITTDWNSTSLHVLPMMQVNCKGLLSHLNKFSGRYDRVLAFKPTGWTYSDRCDSVADVKPTVRGKITMYGIPYSEHSSYLEMKRFVQWLRPQKIIPTVNMGNWKQRTTMEKYFSQWMTEPVPRHAAHS